MEKIRIPILLSTLYLLIYTLSTALPIHLAIPLAFFSLSPVVVIWLVWKVLRDGEPSELTFEEAFYEDHPYRRLAQRNDRKD